MIPPSEAWVGWVQGEGGWPGRPEPRVPSYCLSWGDPAPNLEAVVCAFTPSPSCLPACPPLLQWPVGGLALLPLGSPPGPGPGPGPGPVPVPALIAQEDEMYSFEMSVPRGSHAGKKEIGQKSWAALWHVGSFVQDALLSLTTRRYEQNG